MISRALPFLPRAFGGIAAAIFLFAAPASGESLKDMDREELNSVIREYILENPEVILEAVERYQQRQQQAEQAAKKAALAHMKGGLVDEETPTAGAPDGDVTVVEFFDYQCGYCKRVFPDVMKTVEADKKLKVAFKELPILGEVSTIAARAALASDKQGLYMPFHTELMKLRGRLTESKIYDTAEDVGLDVDRLKEDMQGDDISRHIAKNLALAEALGIRGTPAFIIGDEIVPGAIGRDDIVRLIAEARANG